MAFQRLADFNHHVRILLFQWRDELGQIAAQMKSHGEKERNDDDAAQTRVDRLRDGAREIRLAEFQKCGANMPIGSRFLNLSRQRAHALVGILDAAAMRKQNNAGGCFLVFQLNVHEPF